MNFAFRNIKKEGTFMEKIYLSSPHMSGKELRYIHDAFEKNWIAPLGENVNEFENDLKNYVKSENALALSSGTAAIHLALKALNVSEGDYVICSSFTFAASCNPILYEKAIPIFVDSDESWNMSPEALQLCFDYLINNVGKMPKAVIVVDLYGQSAKWDEILSICDRYGVPIIEDAAEALGTQYHNRYCGTFGKIGIFSFNGNKIITTSGGGMCVTNEKSLRDKMFFWATQSRENERHYEHKEIGYNYRMSNICAGIGRGQMSVLTDRILKKRAIYELYKTQLKSLPIHMMEELEGSSCTYWLSVMVIDDDCNVDPLDILEALDKNNIESRPIWKPMHLQPIFKNNLFFSSNKNVISNSEKYFTKGLCLPSDTKMTVEQQNRVIDIIKGCFQNV